MPGIYVLCMITNFNFTCVRGTSTLIFTRVVVLLLLCIIYSSRKMSAGDSPGCYPGSIVRPQPF